MARRFFKLAFGAVLIHIGLITTVCHAQTAASSPAPNASEDGNKGGKHDRPFRKGYENLSPELQKEFDSLPPDQQQAIKDNLARWEKMSPEERKAMREQAQIRRQKMLQEIEDAIKESGLQLDEKARDEYVIRYTQERRTIEQKLQKEMEEKRRPLLQDLINRLKTEFEVKSSPAPSPAPSSAATATPAS